MSWHRNRRISPIFFGEPTLSWEYLPYHINIREEKSLLSHKSTKCPLNLKKLLFVDQLFIKKVSHTWTGCFSRRKNFKITDNKGSNLFHVVKFVNYGSILTNGSIPVLYNFYSEPDFKPVLTLRGFPGMFGAHMSTKLVQYNGRLHLGKVVQENQLCDPIFSVFDPIGRRSFSIQGPEQGHCWGVVRDAEFNLCQHNEEGGEEKVYVFGLLSRNYRVKASEFTTSTTDKLDMGTKCKWSVEFPKELDPVFKAMVLSGLFLIESQYY